MYGLNACGKGLIIGHGWRDATRSWYFIQECRLRWPSFLPNSIRRSPWGRGDYYGSSIDSEDEDWEGRSVVVRSSVWIQGSKSSNLWCLREEDFSHPWSFDPNAKDGGEEGVGLLVVVTMTKHHQDLEFLIFNGMWRSTFLLPRGGSSTHAGTCG